MIHEFIYVNKVGLLLGYVVVIVPFFCTYKHTMKMKHSQSHNMKCSFRLWITSFDCKGVFMDNNLRTECHCRRLGLTIALHRLL